jgi:hypothetical protein
LCIFLYWGWDSCLAVTEETKDAATPILVPDTGEEPVALHE